MGAKLTQYITYLPSITGSLKLNRKRTAFRRKIAAWILCSSSISGYCELAVRRTMLRFGYHGNALRSSYLTCFTSASTTSSS